MNWDRIAGRWQQLAGAASQHWSRLAGDHAGVVAALRQRSLGQIRAGYAVKKEANAKQLTEWLERQHKVDRIHK
jgi:uncharacterized protein YjbJ (UPF0337 family)